ncbi:hypothetical protein DAI22_09g042401 [Oryza sativa Japonica Group]|nr:hypothetical protein DAI22_09g042401 [Oryza sativa Japonica Group]
MSAKSQLCRISYCPDNQTPERYLAVDIANNNVVKLSKMPSPQSRRRVCELWSMVMNPNPYAGPNVVEVILYHVYKPAAPLTTVGDHLELQPLGQYDRDFSWWTIHLANSDDPRYFGNSQLTFGANFDGGQYYIQWRRSTSGLRAVQCTDDPNRMTVQVVPFRPLYEDQINVDYCWKIVLDPPVIPDIALQRWFPVHVAGTSSYNGMTAGTQQGFSSYNYNAGTTDTTGHGGYGNQEEPRNRRHRNRHGLAGVEDPKKNLAGYTISSDQDLPLVISQTGVVPIGKTEKRANQPVKMSAFAKAMVAPEAPLVTSSSSPVTV